MDFKWKSLLILLPLVLAAGVFFYFFNNKSITGYSVESQAGDNIAQEEYFDAFSHTFEYHWDHMPITYDLQSCKDTFKGNIALDIKNSFLFITEKMEGKITFLEASEEEEVADITFICDIGGLVTKRDRVYEDRGDFTMVRYAETVPHTYEDTNIIAPSEIYIYATHPCIGQKRPTLITRYILYLFGLENNINPTYSGDVMNPYTIDNCESDILEKDLTYLKEIYTPQDQSS